MALVLPVLESWKMSFSSVHFLLFLPLAVAGYFVLPQKCRRVWLLIASYYFYFFAAPKYLLVLVFGTLLSWAMGLVIARAPQKGRWLFVSVVLLGLFLCFFKYNGFFAPFLSPLLAHLGVAYNSSFFTTLGALGISFYTFTAIGYLADITLGAVPAEKNLLNYALFMGFFPTVTMGPICRAGELLPQLKDTTRHFDAATAADGMRTMALGYFKKLAVADLLAVYTGGIYARLEEVHGFTLSFAAILFALQLYFDFSGYSDIALGTAQLLGIRVPRNFNTPYFATNFSDFWQRWHISLSSWLQDYVFMPVVYSRWTQKLPGIGRRMAKPPVLSAIAVTFLLSGIWHGDTLCYVVWGALMAVYRIGEELLHRTLGKPKKRPRLAVRVGKTALVLVLWVESLVFFKVGMDGGSVQSAFSAIVRQFSFENPASFLQNLTGSIATGFYNNRAMIGLFLVFTAVCLLLALWADWYTFARLKGGSLATRLGTLPRVPRYLVYYLLLLCCFAAFIAQNGGFGGGNFLYGGF